MFLATIVPRDNYSSVLLQMVFYNEDGPPDDQNQGNGGAQMVTNDHPDDPREDGPPDDQIKETEERGW